MLHGFVVWVTQHFRSQRFVQVLLQVGQLEQHFPVTGVMYFQVPQVEITFPVGALSLDVINLAINELVSDLSQSWKVRILLLVHNEYHSSP